MFYVLYITNNVEYTTYVCTSIIRHGAGAGKDAFPLLIARCGASRDGYVVILLPAYLLALGLGLNFYRNNTL